MLIVGDNLKALCVQHKVIDDMSSYDVNSLTLKLHDVVKEVNPPANAVIDYEAEVNAEWIREKVLGQEGVELKPNSAVLACSREKVQIPCGYFGLLQTKGSLARLFISVACNDGQIEAGYCGRITFELTNMGPLRVRLHKGDAVAQLFIFRTSTNKAVLYDGRYQNADGPTTFIHR